MKGIFVINPTSGMQLHQNAAHVAAQRLLKNGTLTEARIFYTTGKSSAYNTVKSFSRGEYDFVMAVGGDGTVNEVVNGLIDGGSDIPLAILRAGTTNDFATAMGLPVDSAGIARMISGYHTEHIDVGRVNGRYFLNVAAGGLLSEIAHSVDPDVKTALGKLAYYVQGFKEISSLRLDTVPLRFEMEEASFETDTFLVIVANSCSVGGFSNIAPKAKVNDGLLDVCIIKKLTPADVVPVFTQINAGTHVNDKRCIAYFRTKKLRISSLDDSLSFAIDYDGELGDPLPLDIEVVPSALRLIVPAKSRKAKKLLETT